MQKLCLSLIKKGIIKSAHDMSDGGLSVNIAESILHSKDKSLGAKLNIESKLRDDELLFGECQSVIIITINEKDLITVITEAKKSNVHTQTIGRVTNDKTLTINELVSIDRDKLSTGYNNYYSNLLND